MEITFADKNQYYPQSLPHPGETLSEKLEEMGLNFKEFAVLTGKSERIIISILNGTCAITPDMAAQFENVTQIPVHFWMNSQRGYDEFKARDHHKKYVKSTPELQPA